MSKKKIYHVIQVSQKMIQTFPKQGHVNVVFNAVFYRNGKKMNSIDQADVVNFHTWSETMINQKIPTR